MDALEAAGNIDPPNFAAELTAILPAEPTKGKITAERSLPGMEAKELTLSNGMRVAYRKSDLMEDEIIFSVRGEERALCEYDHFQPHAQLLRLPLA